MVVINDYVFRADRHDNGSKTIFGITRNWDGPETITEIVRGSKQQATARFMARKVFSHFAHARPPASVVNELAASFIAADMSVAALLRAVLVHPRFWDGNSRHQLVKPPVDFIAELVKRTGVPTADQGLLWQMSFTGQIPFDPPNVSGWGENGYWLSTATAWGRQEFGEWALWRSESLELPFLNQIADEGVSPSQAADAIFAGFGILNGSAASRNGLESWFIEMQNDNPWGLDHEGVIMGALLPEFHVA